MENQPQQQQNTTLCNAGCGFYGSAATEGLCSKCFKDSIKRTQDSTSPATRLSPNSSLSTTPTNSTLTATAVAASVPAMTAATEAVEGMDATSPGSGDVAPSDSCIVICDTTGKMSVLDGGMASMVEGKAAETSALTPSTLTAHELSTSGSASSLLNSIGTDGSPSSTSPAKKPNRCHICKKRVGLTGFTCRCGGLFCGEHRYVSDHNCSYDYKTMEREKLKKNCPVVVAEKIKRI